MPTKDYNDKSGLAYYWLDENMGRILLVTLFAGIGLLGLLLEGRTELSLIQRLAKGMGPELAGIVIAAVTIEAIAERRQEAERKRILISQLGSKYRDVTETALIELRNREWLYDGSLNGSYLVGGNLSGAYLTEANLRGANLSGADLSEADLSGADLSEADLLFVNMSRAELFRTDLSKARLAEANLSGAHLLEANLSGAILLATNLSGVHFLTIEQLEQSRALDAAIMPDRVQLGDPKLRFGFDKVIEGPTFSEWKAQYLARQEAERVKNEVDREPGDMAYGQAEINSPEPM